MITTRFREHHPRMRVTLRSATSREISTGLETGELDAGLTYVDNEPLVDVDARPLWRERYLLLTPADGPFGARTTVGWAEAATLPLCLLTPDMQHRRIIDGAFAAAGTVADPVVETNSVSAVIAHARTGVSGVTAQTWISRLTVPAGLRAVPLVDPVLTKTIGIITSARTQRSPVVEELLVLFAPLELDEAVAGP
jgi:DNA-binding transcriptional LysR family regulator